MQQLFDSSRSSSSSTAVGGDSDSLSECLLQPTEYDMLLLDLAAELQERHSLHHIAEHADSFESYDSKVRTYLHVKKISYAYCESSRSLSIII